jgi:hypothetical protein
MDLGSIVVMLKLLGESGLTTEAPPSTTGWEVLTGEGVRDVDYVVGIDPEARSAWQAEQERKKAMREIP